MPRKSRESRLDDIVVAATSVFSRYGFRRAKIQQVAEVASVGEGTIYSYAADKHALFELSVLRALESPLVGDLRLPYRSSGRDRFAQLANHGVAAIAHFPQLWLAGQQSGPAGSTEEYYGILLEMAGWLARYRSFVLLSKGNRVDWPLLSQLLEEQVWSDLRARLTDYLADRIRSGAFADPGCSPAFCASFTVGTLVGHLTSEAWGPEGRLALAGAALVRLVGAPVVQPAASDPGRRMAPEPSGARAAAVSVPPIG